MRLSSYISILPQASSEAIFLNFIPFAKHKRVRAISMTLDSVERKSPIRKFNCTALNSERQGAEGGWGLPHSGVVKRTLYILFSGEMLSEFKMRLAAF